MARSMTAFSSGVVLLLLLLSVAGVSLGADADLTLLSCWAKATFDRAEFPYCKELAAEYVLHWKVANGAITFGIALAGKYKMVGLGLSNSGGMRGADIVALTKIESAAAGVAWDINDYWSTAFETPVLDTKQDWELVEYAGTAQTTLLTVKRLLNTNDRQDIQVYNDTDQLVIYSYGSAFAYHGTKQRGSQLLRLYPANYNISLNVTDVNSTSFNFANMTEFTYRMALTLTDPKDLTALKVLLPNVSVSGVPGVSYKCMAVAAPSQQPKYHVLRYEGLLNTQTTGSSPLWAMRLYGCTSAPQSTAAQDCSGAADAACTIPLAFWGKGMKSNFSLPQAAGLPLSTGYNSSTPFKFLQLVVTYNVTQAPAKQVYDSSGLALYYTAQLRPYDAGVLQLGGASPRVSTLAPNSTLDQWCPSACTQRVQYNLTLVSSYLYMNTAGSSITTRHISNGNRTVGRAELQPLGAKDYWWTGWQAFTQVLPLSRNFTPGDTLTTSCNSSAAAATGPCLNWLHYYPAVPGWTDCTRQQGSFLSSCPVLASFGNLSTDAGTLGRLLTTQQAGLAATLRAALTAATTTTANGTAAASKLQAQDLHRLSMALAAALPQYKDLTALGTSLKRMVTQDANNASLTPGMISSPAALSAALPGVAPLLRQWLTDAFNASYNASAAVNATAAAGRRLQQQGNSSGMVALFNASTTTVVQVLPALLDQSGLNSTSASGALLLANATAALGNLTVQQLVNVADANNMLQTLDVAVATAADTNFTSWSEPYWEPPEEPQPSTGPAAACIVVVVLGLLAIQAFLWHNYGRKEDPERLALLAQLQAAILEEAIKNPGQSEEELKKKLEVQVRKQYYSSGQADGANGTNGTHH